MFIIFKNCVIHLCILSIACSPLPNSENSPEPADDFEKQVEKEVLPFSKFVNAISDSVDKGEFKGQLNMFARRLVKAETDNKMLLRNEGGFEKEKESIIKSALKTFVVPYVCRNFELYEKVWDNGGKNKDDFNPDVTENTDVKRHDLDAQTMSNYRHHAKVWDRILTSSSHPLVKDFIGRIQLLYPELNLQMVAKNLGLAYALLNNAKHGVINDEPEIAKLVNPDDLIEALRGWDAFKDPVLLNIIKTFQQVVSGL